MEEFQHQFDEIETGSRPSINQETESYFDESYESMATSLDAQGEQALSGTLNGLSSEQKEELAKALNAGGYDWEFIATAGKGQEIPAMRLIDGWRSEIAAAADTEAIRAAGKRLVEGLYEL